MAVHRFDRAGIRTEIDPDTFAHRLPGPIITRYATRGGDCYLCGDAVLPGDLVVDGDEDDPYLHPDCLRREQEEP
jgi:hypothetical protein